jgi:hypothetical protein
MVTTVKDLARALSSSKALPLSSKGLSFFSLPCGFTKAIENFLLSVGSLISESFENQNDRAITL